MGTLRPGRRAERRAAWWYRLRGYRVLSANAWVAGYELDLVVRRGRRLIFCEVKEKAGDGFGEPFEMVDAEKQRRLRRAAEAWLAAHPEASGLPVSFDVIAIQNGRLRRLAEAF
jgi:putative endonuclease